MNFWFGLLTLDSSSWFGMGYNFEISQSLMDGKGVSHLIPPQSHMVTFENHILWAQLCRTRHLQALPIHQLGWVSRVGNSCNFLALYLLLFGKPRFLEWADMRTSAFCCVIFFKQVSSPQHHGEKLKIMTQVLPQDSQTRRQRKRTQRF